jgi:hypothetical protein
VTYEPGQKELEMLSKGVEVVGKIWFGLSKNNYLPVRFKYYFNDSKDGNTMTTLKNDYVFENVIAGTALINDKKDHVEMQDEIGRIFDDNFFVLIIWANTFYR